MTKSHKVTTDTDPYLLLTPLSSNTLCPNYFQKPTLLLFIFLIFYILDVLDCELLKDREEHVIFIQTHHPQSSTGLQAYD